MPRYPGLVATITLAGTLAAAPRISTNGHYFLRDGKPFFWLGDTNWTLFTLYTPSEAEEYLDHRARQGFTVINVMMIFSGGPGIKPTVENTEGHAPFLNGNPATPNEAFFRNVDRGLALAQARNLVLAVMPCGGSSGAFVKKQKLFTEANVRIYGRWLGRRYRNVPNLIWVNGFDLKSSEYVELTEALAAGLREGDRGTHLITFHPGGGNSSSYFHARTWLAYNTIQMERLLAHPPLGYGRLLPAPRQAGGSGGGRLRGRPRVPDSPDHPVDRPQAGLVGLPGRRLPHLRP